MLLLKVSKVYGTKIDTTPPLSTILSLLYFLLLLSVSHTHSLLLLFYFYLPCLYLYSSGLTPMTVNFSSVGSVEVGHSLTITCTITTVERLVVTPLITFIKMNETMEMLSNLNRPYSITTDDTGSGSVTNYTVILDPVRFEDGAIYTCMAEFNVTGFNNTDDPSTATYDYQEANDTFTLIVDCKLIIYMYLCLYMYVEINELMFL